MTCDHVRSTGRNGLPSSEAAWGNLINVLALTLCHLVLLGPILVEHPAGPHRSEDWLPCGPRPRQPFLRAPPLTGLARDSRPARSGPVTGVVAVAVPGGQTLRDSVAAIPGTATLGISPLCWEPSRTQGLAYPGDKGGGAGVQQAPPWPPEPSCPSFLLQHLTPSCLRSCVLRLHTQGRTPFPL